MQTNAREIPLTRGKVAIVDAEDYVFLSQWKWSFAGTYAFRSHRVNGKSTRIHMHHEILGVVPVPGKLQVDHINLNKLDNRRCNLRICTPQQNMRNQAKKRNKSSAFKGVSLWRNQPDKWIAQIYLAGTRIYLGRFGSEIDAALAYDTAAREYFGQFARLNFPVGDERGVQKEPIHAN